VKRYVFCLAIIAQVFFACSEDSQTRDLERAAKAVEQMVAPLNATRSSFFVVLPDGTPKQFVSWFFSPMGSAEWPMVDDSPELSEDEANSMRSIGMPFRPKDVHYTHSKPDTTVQKQIVLTWNDTDGTVVLEGYKDPAQEPIFKKSFVLPKNVVSDAMAKIAAQSNLELGMSFQSF
jgi:hypothetical protein